MDFHRTSKMFILQIVLTTYYVLVLMLFVDKPFTCSQIQHLFYMPQCAYTCVHHTFKIEMHYLVTYVQLFK